MYDKYIHIYVCVYSMYVVRIQIVCTGSDISKRELRYNFSFYTARISHTFDFIALVYCLLFSTLNIHIYIYIYY